MPPLPPPPPPLLVDDLEEDVLIRFPPKDPAALVRTALVCKRWRRLVSGPSFRRRFAEFHRAPPMLGMFCNRGFDSVPHFVPTATFRPRYAERGYRCVIDARHGRVLLHCKGPGLSVWDPIMDEEWKTPFPPLSQRTRLLGWAAAVLCPAAGCNHLACRRRHFVVVFVNSFSIDPDAPGMTFIYTYSSNDAAWSEPTIWAQQPDYQVSSDTRSALVGNTLYFGTPSSALLKYDMKLRQMSWIQLPHLPLRLVKALTATEDSGLQFAVEYQYKLCIWSTKDTVDEVGTRWEQNRVFEFDTLLPLDADLTRLDVVGFMDGLGTIFVSVDNAAYAIDLKTCKSKKVYEGTIDTVVPYVSFYTPALEAEGTCEGPSAGCSSA